jgi:lambda family phage portal protein
MATRRNSGPSIAESFDTIKADYNAMRASRYRRRRQGTALVGTNADYHFRYLYPYLRMVEEARDMDRNDVLIGQTVDRAVTNTVQAGMVVDPKTTDTGVNDELWNRFESWKVDPDQVDIQGEHNYHDLEQLILRSEFVDGDIFAIPGDEGHLQCLECHRCRTPTNTTKNVVHGIVMDEFRRRQQYWFTRDDINPLTTVKLVSQMYQVNARDEEGNRQVFHIYNPKRVTQTRGISALAPIFDVAGMFEDVNFAALVRQQISCCVSIFRENTEKTSELPSLNQPLGERRNELRADGTNSTIEGMRPGMIIDGKPGQKLTGFSPNTPPPGFFDHIKLILSLIGVNLGLPLILVLMDASETNFSGWRGAIDQARLGFKRNQRALISRFHTPVWKWKVRQWIEEDPALKRAAAELGDNIFAHRWNAPRWPYIEPLTDRQADAYGILTNLNSRRRQCEENAMEWETLSDEIVADNAYAIRGAKKEAAAINKDFPDEKDLVHWRELIALPLPQGMTIAPFGGSVNSPNTNGKPAGKKANPSDTSDEQIPAA